MTDEEFETEGREAVLGFEELMTSEDEPLTTEEASNVWAAWRRKHEWERQSIAKACAATYHEEAGLKAAVLDLIHRARLPMSGDEIVDALKDLVGLPSGGYPR